jgi:hypothetical protein
LARAVGLDAIGDLDRLLPPTIDVAREPDPDVGMRSCVPPNQAAARVPALVSTIVEAWAWG